jgi:hypothetical protein
MGRRHFGALEILVCDDNHGPYSRLATRHPVRHISGNPTVVPKNMSGAGGLGVAHYMWHLAAQGGTSLAMVSGVLSLQIVETPGTDY